MMNIPANWRLRRVRLRLEGEICPSCEAPIFPPRDVCPGCGVITKADLIARLGLVRGEEGSKGKGELGGLGVAILANAAS